MTYPKKPITNDSNSGIDLSTFLNIDAYKNNSTLSDNLGVPLLNRYVCLLNAPTQSSGIFSKNGWLELQVLSVDCPALTVDFAEFELNGVKRFYGKGLTHDDLQITFLETPDLSLRRFFYAWQSLAVKASSTEGTTRLYQDQFTCKELKIAPLDFEGKAYYADRFIGAFPTRIADINYNYGTSGEMLKTIVTFKYEFHDVVAMDNSDSYHFSVKNGIPEIKENLFK